MIIGLLKSVMNCDGTKSKFTQLVLEQIRSKKGHMEAIAKYVDMLNNEELLDQENRQRANHQLWEKVSGELVAEQAYTIGQEKGLKPGSQLQLELLHALGYDDRLVCDAYLFNTCTKCGMAIPSKCGGNVKKEVGIDQRRYRRRFQVGCLEKGKESSPTSAWLSGTSW